MDKIDIGIFQQSKKGCSVNGDSYGIFRTDDRVLITVADGLGSGAKAHHASQMAVELIGHNLDKEPEEMLKIVNESLYATRGTALGIADVNLKTLCIKYYSVGNIQGMIWGAKKSFLVSTPGIVGYRYSLPIQQTICKLEPADALVLYTDGLTIRNIPDYFGSIEYFTAQNLADFIVEKHQRNNDDLVLLTLLLNT